MPDTLTPAAPPGSPAAESAPHNLLPALCASDPAEVIPRMRD